MSSCPRGALKVGGGYIYVDASACDNCLACVEVCDRQAIMGRSTGRPVASKGAGAAARVVVGSRAEAKALRQEALDVQKHRERSATTSARGAAAKQAVQRLDAADAAEGRVAWSMLDAGAVLAVMMLSLFATDLIVGSRAIALMPPSGQAAARAAVLAGFFAVQIATLAFLAGRHGSRLAPAFGLARMGRAPMTVVGTSLMVIGLAAATRAASTLWGVFARAVGWPPPGATGLTSVFGGGGLGLMVAVVALVVLAPLAEEMAFRGVLLRAAGARWGKWPAIIGTSVVFAAYHVTAWTMVPLLVLGIALGWLAWSRRSVWAAVFLHALYNGVVVAAAYWLAR